MHLFKGSVLSNTKRLFDNSDFILQSMKQSRKLHKYTKYCNFVIAVYLLIMPIFVVVGSHSKHHGSITYRCSIMYFCMIQVSRGKGLKFKRLEDFLKDSHRKHRDETRIRRLEHKPPEPLPPAKNRLAFAVRIREYVL